MHLYAVNIASRLVIVVIHDVSHGECFRRYIFGACRCQFSLLSTVLNQLYNLSSAVISLITAQLAHSICTGLAPPHRSRAHSVGKHITHMALCAAACHKLVTKRTPYGTPITKYILFSRWLPNFSWLCRASNTGGLTTRQTVISRIRNVHVFKKDAR